MLEQKGFFLFKPADRRRKRGQRCGRPRRHAEETMELFPIWMSGNGMGGGIVLPSASHDTGDHALLARLPEEEQIALLDGCADSEELHQRLEGLRMRQ